MSTISFAFENVEVATLQGSRIRADFRNTRPYHGKGSYDSIAESALIIINNDAEIVSWFNQQPGVPVTVDGLYERIKRWRDIVAITISNDGHERRILLPWDGSDEVNNLESVRRTSTGIVIEVKPAGNRPD